MYRPGSTSRRRARTTTSVSARQSCTRRAISTARTWGWGPPVTAPATRVRTAGRRVRHACSSSEGDARDRSSLRDGHRPGHGTSWASATRSTSSPVATPACAELARVRARRDVGSCSGTKADALRVQADHDALRGERRRRDADHERTCGDVADPNRLLEREALELRCALDGPNDTEAGTTATSCCTAARRSALRRTPAGSRSRRWADPTRSPRSSAAAWAPSARTAAAPAATAAAALVPLTVPKRTSPRPRARLRGGDGGAGRDLGPPSARPRDENAAIALPSRFSATETPPTTVTGTPAPRNARISFTSARGSPTTGTPAGTSRLNAPAGAGRRRER